MILLFLSCRESNNFKNYKKGHFSLSSGERITVFLAKSQQQQVQGLSGVKKSDFNDNESMLFWGFQDGVRQFWMPNTFFNLDIFFLTKDYHVIDIERNMQHFPSTEPQSEIPRTKSVYCRHVLEMSSSSSLAKKIKIGDKLNIELNH